MLFLFWLILDFVFIEELEYCVVDSDYLICVWFELNMIDFV